MFVFCSLSQCRTVGACLVGVVYENLICIEPKVMSELQMECFVCKTQDQTKILFTLNQE